MRALLYDIHGNLPALEAVLEDAVAQGADEFVLGGDYALAGAWPDECVKRIEKLTGQWIRGNTERWLEDPSDTPDDELLHRAIDFCRSRLGVHRVEELYRLPMSAGIDGACVCHAAPHDDTLTFPSESTAGDAELLAHTQAGIVVFGHSHLQFMRTAATGQLLVNPGSVGLPFDGDRRAAYALWNGGRVRIRVVGNTAQLEVAAAVRERMSEALGPTVDTLVRRIEQAAMVS